MEMIESFSAWVSKRPIIALFLLVAFVIAEYGNWERGRDISRVCALIPHSVGGVKHPVTPQQEIDKICSAREPADFDRAD